MGNSGINATGIPRTADYDLGRGILYFADLDASSNPKAWRDLGNCPDFKVTVESEELVHEASRTGTKTEDASVALKRGAAFSLVLDSIEFDNLALFFAGETATLVTNSATAGFTEHAMYVGVTLGRWYDLISSAGVRAYDIDKTLLVLEKSGAPDVLLVENTDYTVDEKMGRVFLKSTAVNIAAGDTLDGTLTADAGAVTLQQVKFLTKATTIGALKFIAENPNNASRLTETQFHRVTIDADGDYAMISDEWVRLGLKGKITKSDSTRYTASPYGLMTTHANA